MKGLILSRRALQTAPRISARLVALAVLGLSAGCAVGPNYVRPQAPVAPAWQTSAPWREVQPRDGLPKGEWWAVFRESELDTLEKQALAANQSLQVAAARYAQAQAALRVQVAAGLPELDVAASGERQRLSGNRPPNGPNPIAGPYTQNAYLLPFNVRYEVDLFGRRRRSVEAARASAQASAADLENARLIVSAELAIDYFRLRQTDAELGTLERAVSALQKGLELVRARHDGGIASGLDVAQEETLLRTTETRATLLLQQRQQLEDAIAVLIGVPSPTLQLARRELSTEPPALALGLPSDLLERRPDVAEAERLMALANAKVGVAKSAFFPSLSLFGSAGWQATTVSSLVHAASALWAIGASAAETIFSGGARRAELAFARAGYQASVASYRGTVLAAIQEVQDEVTGLEVLGAAAEKQEQALAAARRTLEIATSRYTGGLASYLDVVSAQENLLANEEQMVTIRGERLVASVRLVEALGGGWDAASLSVAAPSAPGQGSTTRRPS